MEVTSTNEITNSDLALFENALTEEGSNSIELRIFTIKRVSALAKALGPKRTREELLQKLASQIDELEDEVLLYLCEELELLLPLVGGPEYCHGLLTMLLNISRKEETPVYNRAVEAIKNILTQINQELTEKYLISPLVQISDSDGFSEIRSMLSIIPVCYPMASEENRGILRRKFLNTFEDSGEIVREIAAAELPSFLEVLEIEHVLKDFLPLLDRIVTSYQDPVRLHAIESILVVAKKSINLEIKDKILNMVEALSCDESWRIRQKVALTMEKISETFPGEDKFLILLTIYENLTEDESVNVRIVAAKTMYENFKQFKSSVKKFDEVFLEKCFPILLAVVNDESTEVQIAISSSILLLGNLISSDCFKVSVLPIILEGLQEDRPLQFKENILMNLDNLPTDVNLIESLDSVNSIMEHIIVSSGSSWRSRRSLLKSFIHASNFCTEEFFKENFLVYYVILMKDNIYAVRRTASLILPILAENFGARWLLNDMMSHIYPTVKDEKYLYRYIPLFCIQELIFPSIHKADVSITKKYFENVKGLIAQDEEKYKNILCRISRLNNRLRNNLKNKCFETTLRTYNDFNNIHSENIRLYCEDFFDTLREPEINAPTNYKNQDLFYLEGILLLLNGEVLKVLSYLMKDPINNVQDKAKFVLKMIEKFSDGIYDEVESSWVVKYTNKVSDSTWKLLDTEIDQELAKNEPANGYERINTNFLDYSLQKKFSYSERSIDSLDLEIYPNDKLQSTKLHVDGLESLNEEKN